MRHVLRTLLLGVTLLTPGMTADAQPDVATPLLARMNRSAIVLASQPAGSSAAPAAAPAALPFTTILFTNVRIFDGKNPQLRGPLNVLVRNGKIERVTTDAIPTDRSGLTRIYNGEGTTLMPGLIDAHWHTMMARPSPAVAMQSDFGYLNLLASAEAGATLMRGFTTVRDLGGPAFGLKQAIDEDLVAGPRIFPCGAMISITGGHGDFRAPHELPRAPSDVLSRTETLGATLIADSPDEVRRRTREELLKGATQIKLTAGGGVASPHSPLDVSTFTVEELRASVEAAENWGTYVTVHAYTPQAIRRAIDAGVKCIEHGHLTDEATMQLMAEKGIWLSTQPFLENMAAMFPPGTPQFEKMQAVVVGTPNVYTLAKKHGVKTAFGTDILFSQAMASRQGAMLTAITRWYSPAEALIMATGTNAELLALSGLRSPYPGKLGVIEEGALADLLLVNGDPIANIALIEDPDENFVVIMKNGRVYKDTTPK